MTRISLGSYDPRPRLRLKDYLELSCNREAKQLAQQFCSNDENLQVLFIGDSGTGKTTLLNAVVNELAETRMALYVNSCDYINSYINSIRHGKGEEFNQDLMGLDVVAIDNFQYFAHKENTIRKVIELHDVQVAGGQRLIYTMEEIDSDHLPEAVRNRLRGMTHCRLLNPTLEDVFEFAKQVSDRNGMILSNSQLHIIAERKPKSLSKISEILSHIEMQLKHKGEKSNDNFRELVARF